MRGISITKHCGAEAMRVQALDAPQAGPGEVCVAIEACGVNHLDVWVRKGVPGHHFPLPLIPGSDVAGTVAAVGLGVAHVKVGDPVVVAPGVGCGVCALCAAGRDQHCRAYAILGEHRDGGYAEQVVVPAANVIARPPSLSSIDAAAMGVAFLTAWHMLVSRAQLVPGEVVLIQAAGSGVGSAATQIAQLFGATVIAAASTDDKLARARALGAAHTINNREEDTAKRVHAITHKRGADVVIEHVGPATWEHSVRALARQGRLVTCGATTGPEVKLNLQHLFFKSQSILGSTMGSRGEFANILTLAAAGKLRPVVDHVLPLAEAGQAHTLLETRQVFGKIILDIRR